MFWNAKSAATNSDLELAQRQETRKTAEITATFTRLARSVNIEDVAAQFQREADRKYCVIFRPELDEVQTETRWQRWNRPRNDLYRIYKPDVLSNSAFGAFRSALAQKGISCELTDLEDPSPGFEGAGRDGAKIKLHLFSKTYNPPLKAPYGFIEMPS